MTKTLEQAFREASKLPESEQDALAEAIRTEIMAEEDREESFRKSQGVLESRTSSWLQATAASPKASPHL